LIYYQYAKIVARRAFDAVDGKETQGRHYGFIKKMFKELKSGDKPWSEITREALRLAHGSLRVTHRVNFGLWICDFRSFTKPPTDRRASSTPRPRGGRRLRLLRIFLDAQAPTAGQRPSAQNNGFMM